MALLTQYKPFFISPFGESSVCDELNKFLSSNRIVNVEKHLIDGERFLKFFADLPVNANETLEQPV
jgi:hypothetical protein